MATGNKSERLLTLAFSRPACLGGKAALNSSRECRSGDHGCEAEHVVRDNVEGEQAPVSLLEVSDGFKGVAGECRVGAAEANGHQPSPLWIDEDSLGGPDKKESQNETACDIDEKRAVRKVCRHHLGGESAYKIAKIGA